MVRVTALSSPFLLGFDDIERALDKVSKTATDGYPPYNIERIAASGAEPEKLRITLAVAGFSREQIEVTVEESQLIIRGRQQEDKTREFLHTAIPRRQSSAASSWPRACRFWAPTWRRDCCRSISSGRSRNGSSRRSRS